MVVPKRYTCKPASGFLTAFFVLSFASVPVALAEDPSNFNVDPRSCQQPLRTAKNVKEQAEALVGRGNDCWVRNKKDQAIKDYSAAIALDPDNHRAYYSRGIAYVSIGNQRMALDDFNKAIELEPQRWVYFDNRGELFEKLYNLPKAIEDYGKSIKINFSDTWALNRRGLVYEKIGDLGRAKENFEVALSLNPNDPNIGINFERVSKLLSLHKRTEGVAAASRNSCKEAFVQMTSKGDFGPNADEDAYIRWCMRGISSDASVQLGQSDHGSGLQTPTLAEQSKPTPRLPTDLATATPDNSKGPSKTDFLGSATTTVLEYVGDLPPVVVPSARVTLNGADLIVRAIDTDAKTVTFLGPSPLMRDGLNVLQSTLGSWSFWWENSRLQSFVHPYASGKSYAVIAAIDDYDRAGDPEHRGKTGYPPLSNMVSGAEELRKVLITLGFDNIVTLYDRDATSANIERSIHEFWSGGEHSDADRIFIYFGGHGDQINGPGTGFLVTYDYEPKKPGTRYMMSRFVSEHFPNITAQAVLVALDACSSGFAIPQLMGRGLDRRELERFATLAEIKAQLGKKARNLLVASTDAEPALDQGGGLFTQALVASLSGDADLFHRGVIRFSELALRVHELVAASALALHAQQDTKQFVARGSGEGGEMLFLTDEWK